DAAGDFFRAAQKQRPAQYQGLYLVSPDGKVLASHQNFKSHKTWPEELLDDLRPGLKAFGAVRPREVRRDDPTPRRGSGVRPDGRVKAVEGGVAHVVYEGALAGSHLNQAKKRTHGEVKLTGVGRHDVKSGRLLSLVWVFDGVYKGAPPYDQPHSYGAVVEWAR